MSGHERKWWKSATVYQIYPSTFCDSNGDGIGDIPGILTKLDHIKSLGADTIWLSPHYKSPQVDMGYDISDFEDIHEPYGNLEECQNLINECHTRGLKIIFDLVINHTSSEHAWFKESRSSKTSPKRDWYFWRPPTYDQDGKRQPPNNWRSQFSVPAWTWDPLTEEYYLHVYAPEMPDLNWENADTRQAIYNTSMRFWLDRGLDGFRIDTVNKYSKDTSFPDAEITDLESITQPSMAHYSNGPRIHEFLSEMHAVFSEYKTFDGQEVMTVGELPNTPNASDVLAYVSAAKNQLDMVFNFDVVGLGQKPGDRLVSIPFSNAEFKKEMSRWQEFISNKEHADAWTTVFLENHDQGRSISRFGCDQTEEMRVRSGKMLATILATMTGTLFLYQGQEIGMVNIPSEWGVEEYKDVRSINFFANLKSGGASEERLADALKGMQKMARDNARLPMQWDNSEKAGFCVDRVEPWMRVHPNHTHLNARAQLIDSNSLLSFWKDVLKLRKKHAHLFIYGEFALLDTAEEIFAFRKSDQETGGEAVVIANVSRKPVRWDMNELGGKGEGTKFETALRTVVRHEDLDREMLGPYEARVYVNQR